MKIVSSFLMDLNLKTGEYHAFNFESTYLLKLFKYHINAFFNRKKQTDSVFVSILDDNNREMKAKEFYFINFDSSYNNLETEKETKKQIQEILFH